MGGFFCWEKMSPAELNAEVTAARRSGAQLQAQYNKQASEQYSAYKGIQSRANSAYSNLLNYNKSMVDPSKMYSQAVSQAQAAQGFDPRTLATATKNLTQSQNALSALNSSAQQGVNGYGLTGSQLASRYASLTQPLQGVISAQNNAVGNLQQLYQNSLTQGQQSAALGFQGQQLKSQNYQELYKTSVQQMQTSGSVLKEIENLQQQQGYLTAQQVSAYQNAYSSYVQAQAAQQQAAAAMVQAQGSANLANQQAAQIAYNIQQQKAYADAQKRKSQGSSRTSGTNMQLQGSLYGGKIAGVF